MNLKQQKARSRMEDLRRLAAGEVTPEQLQAENAFLKDCAKFEITVESIRRSAHFFHRKRT